MASYPGKILITGFGIVAQALLPLLVRHLRVPCAPSERTRPGTVSGGVQITPRSATCGRKTKSR